MLPLLLLSLVSPQSPLPSSPAAGTRLLDLDGDGALDLLVHQADGTLLVRRSIGPRQFGEVVQDLPRVLVTEVLCGDLDGDGRLDLYLVSPGADVALVGEGGGRFREATAELGLVESGPGVSAERRDVDGDGLEDLLVHNQGSDVLFWARADGRYEREPGTLDGAATLAGPLVVVPGWPAPEADGTPGTSPGAAHGSGSALAGAGSGATLITSAVPTPAPSTTPIIAFPSNADARYVNDNQNEVDSADIVDGSLTGADVSTSGGDVTFGGYATVTARKGVFGQGSTASGQDSTVSGGVGNSASGQYSTVAGGWNNTSSGQFSTVGGGVGNPASGPLSTVSGGVANTASSLRSTVSGGAYNTAMGTSTTVAGGQYNSATGEFSTVGGGAGNAASGHWSVAVGLGNTASGLRSTVSGGSYNTAMGDDSTVSGGNDNTALSFHTTVAGGQHNQAWSLGATVSGGRINYAIGQDSTVAGGLGSGASGVGSTVSGGKTNDASGNYSTVAGGTLNSAGGGYSFAAGRQAQANHSGSFVWGDSGGAAKTSSANDQFNVYASGGARVFSNAAATTGVLLAPGAGSWTSVSDRNAKENLEPVDAIEVLEAVSRIPISTWNYKTQDDSIRHMGPMAQDFYAAFALGLGETSIDTIDPDGVALAAIQGLNEKLSAKLEELQAELATLRAELAARR